MRTLIKNGLIINEDKSAIGHIVIQDSFIESVSYSKNTPEGSFDKIIDASKQLVIPGIIDTHVHFRDPGLTHKADFHSESKAALSGGVTSVFDMPNVIPQTTTKKLIEQKIESTKEKSLVNFAFYIGATNDNLDELLNINPKIIPGIKVFIASSTGNMLIDNEMALNNIFSKIHLPIVIHSEDELMINANLEKIKQDYNNKKIPFSLHPYIRSREACIKATEKMVLLAQKHHTRLHFLHITTAEEIDILSNTDNNITAEVCVSYLQFSDADYAQLGSKIKVNPAIKTENDRLALINAIANNNIQTISTDHAPHTETEKDAPYLKAPSGTPSIQHSFNILFELYRNGYFSLETIVDKLCHQPAKLFQIEKRGFIKENYFADIAIINPNTKWTVSKDNILSKCDWSALEGTTFHSKCTHTFVNGNLVFENGHFDETKKGIPIKFDR